MDAPAHNVTQQLSERVVHWLVHHALWRSDALLVVAVSGGPDSLCLLHVLWHARARGGPQLHVVHLDHGFRGDESADEARFVADVCRQWHIAASITYHDVATFAATHHHNKQAAARLVRYRLLADVAQRIGADGVVVAHHADDQAETVLLHLLRGAGLAGLRGMRPIVAWHEWAEPLFADAPHIAHHAPLLRPLLTTTRADIERYCHDAHLAPRHDPSNTSHTYTRNRIRAELLPLMATYNQHIVAALCRTAHTCADDYAYIQQHVDLIWNDAMIEQHDGVVRIWRDAWHDVPVALQRHVVRRAVNVVHGGGSYDDVPYEQLEAMCDAITAKPTGYELTIVGGVRLMCDYASVVLFHANENNTDTSLLCSTLYRDVPQLSSDNAHEYIVVPLPGSVALDTTATWHITITYERPAPLLSSPTSMSPPWRWWVMLDADALGAFGTVGTTLMIVRGRRAGDTFRPAGGHGSRRVQDFFVDSKVPLLLRNRLPLLVLQNTITHDEQIVWVAGLRADARFQATSHTATPVWVIIHQNFRTTLPQT